MEERCLLCGRRHEAGLKLMDCFLCFDCERALLRPDAVKRLRRRKRLRLLRLIV